MADEKKKPWQFSLGRALIAMTVICVTLAASRGRIGIITDDFAVLIVLIGFNSAAGYLMGGFKGAVITVLAGIDAACAIIIFLKMLYYLS